MLFGKTKMELKVGIFVFCGLIILMIFVLSIGGFKTWSLGYRIKFNFNFVNGLKIGAPIRFAGVDVGQVKQIKFIPSPDEGIKLEITGWLKKQVKVPADSRIWVNTLGLLGEKYIEIMPGKDYANCLLPNQSLTGHDPVPMHVATGLAKTIVDDIDAVILKIRNGEGTIGKLFSDDTLYNELEALVSDLRKHPWKLFKKTK